mgnify:CR=1 FL=1
MIDNRELDARIAEHVMGWTDVRLYCANSGDPEALGTAPGKNWREVVPDYSTDISAAWLVVQKLGARGFMMHKSVVGNYWRARFDIPVLAMEEPYVLAETAPLAICRAALLLVKQ